MEMISKTFSTVGGIKKKYLLDLEYFTGLYFPPDALINNCSLKKNHDKVCGVTPVGISGGSTEDIPRDVREGVFFSSTIEEVRVGISEKNNLEKFSKLLKESWEGVMKELLE